jgi:hypothetical protein
MRWTLFLLSSATVAFAEPLISAGGFESPVVRERTPASAGGTPIKGPGNQDWMEFLVKAGTAPGFTAGIANGFSRTGNQSLYVCFDQFNGTSAGCTLVSKLIPIQADSKYRASIWGRSHPERPLTLDQRAPFLKFMAEFFLPDGIANTGESEIRLHPLPDNRVRLGKHPPLFNSSQWNEFGIDLTAPADAAFIRITWKIEVGREPGTTSGIFYLDDAGLTGPRPSPEPVPAESKEP